MPPDDPLGRHGPSLDNFLRKKPIVPEHKKQPCPYGNCPYEYFPCTLRVQYTIKLGLISINTEKSHGYYVLLLIILNLRKCVSLKTVFTYLDSIHEYFYE